MMQTAIDGVILCRRSVVNVGRNTSIFSAMTVPESAGIVKAII
jgi:hypothetical protein